MANDILRFVPLAQFGSAMLSYLDTKGIGRGFEPHMGFLGQSTVSRTSASHFWDCVQDFGDSQMVDPCQLPTRSVGSPVCLLLSKYPSPLSPTSQSHSGSAPSHLLLLHICLYSTYAHGTILDTCCASRVSQIIMRFTLTALVAATVTLGGAARTQHGFGAVAGRGDATEELLDLRSVDIGVPPLQSVWGNASIVSYIDAFGRPTDTRLIEYTDSTPPR